MITPVIVLVLANYFYQGGMFCGGLILFVTVVVVPVVEIDSYQRNVRKLTTSRGSVREKSC